MVRRPFSAHLRKPRCTVCACPDVQHENKSTAEVSEVSCEVTEQGQKQKTKKNQVSCNREKDGGRIFRKLGVPPHCVPLHCPLPAPRLRQTGTGCTSSGTVSSVPAWAELWCPTGPAVTRISANSHAGQSPASYGNALLSIHTEPPFLAKPLRSGESYGLVKFEA